MIALDAVAASNADAAAWIRMKPVRLWLERGELHYKAPRGALTSQELAALHSSRSDIVASLRQAFGSPPADLRSLVRIDQLPLTHAQVARWDGGRLAGRDTIRQIATAVRLRGRLQAENLRRSLTTVVRRHEALRTRFAAYQGIPAQVVSDSDSCDLPIDDLSGLAPEDRETAVIALIDRLILEPIRLGSGPLFGARLARLSEHEHVFIAAMEHIIGDAASIDILLRDLFTAYVQMARGNSSSLPPVTLQIGDYAIWQKSIEPAWLRRHGEWWEDLAKCQRLKFPDDPGAALAGRSGWDVVPVHIDGAVTAGLRAWCRAQRTTLVMSVLTAYVALVLRWCNRSEGVIRFELDGRSDPKLHDTIGFIAAPIYLRVTLGENDRFVDLLKQVTQQHYRAHEHADLLYLEGRVPRLEIVGAPLFNWVPSDPAMELAIMQELDEPIAASPIAFTNPVFRDLYMDSEPCLLIYDRREGITADMVFPADRFGTATMQRFGRNFLGFMTALLQQPQLRLLDVPLQ